MLSGIGLMVEAGVVTVTVLAGNTPLWEATYEVRGPDGTRTLGKVRDELTNALEKASYPICAVDLVEVDAVAASLGASPLFTYASWSSCADD